MGVNHAKEEFLPPVKSRLKPWPNGNARGSLFQALGSWGRAKKAGERGKNEGETKARLSLPLGFSSLARFFRSPPTTESLEQATQEEASIRKYKLASGGQTDSQVHASCQKTTRLWTPP